VQNGEAAALGERCGEAQGGCSPFIGAGEGWPGRLTPVLMALTPLKTGRLDERLRSAIKEGNQGAG
jgi:hypothetical protein